MMILPRAGLAQSSISKPSGTKGSGFTAKLAISSSGDIEEEDGHDSEEEHVHVREEDGRE
jgi:hypothetical protein